MAQTARADDLTTPTIAEKAAASPSAPVTLADLAQLQAEMRGNQLKPSEPNPDVQPATVEPSQPEAGTSAPPAPAASELTARPEDATKEAGAAAVTITGQNERTGSNATEAAKPASEQMPAEDETLPKTAPAKSPFAIRPRRDGVPDVLDAIQELGGIKPPGPNAGGEYDGFREAMVGPARMLINRNAKHAPDTIIPEIHDTHGFRTHPDTGRPLECRNSRSQAARPTTEASANRTATAKAG